MRGAFIETLLAQAAGDDRIFLVTGDLGWRVLEPFAEKYPDRFLNVGVAEQNMIGVATGLAQAGFVPFAYSIASFIATRPYEQVRMGQVLHRLPVRIVGIGGGFAYGHAGPTHYAIEDLAIHRVQPGMTVIAPADPAQTRGVMEAIRGLEGPCYLRIGKGGNPEVPGLNGRFAFGRPEIVIDGPEVLLLATGAIAANAAAAAKSLQAAGVGAACAVMAHLPFAPTPELADLLGRYRRVLTVEEGVATGGLASLAAECASAAGRSTMVAAAGIREGLGAGSGSPDWMTRRSGLDAPGLAEAVRRLLAAPAG